MKICGAGFRLPNVPLLLGASQTTNLTFQAGYITWSWQRRLAIARKARHLHTKSRIHTLEPPVSGQVLDTVHDAVRGSSQTQQPALAV